MGSPEPTGMSDVGQGSSDTSTSPVSPTGQEALNPSWEPVLKDMPEIFHDKLKGHFKSWDDNYRKLESQYRESSERYKPYEQYLGVDPQAIQYGLTMLQRAQQDPLELYNSLRQYVEQQGLLKDQTQGQEEDLETDPRLAEFERRQQMLDERQQQMDNFIQEQVHDQTVAQYRDDVTSQVESIVQKYGEHAVNKEDLLMRMWVQANQSDSGEYNAEAAYQQQLATFKALYAQQNGTSRRAPNVLPVGGATAPITEVKPEDMNEEQRAAYFKRLLDMANSGG